MAILTFQPFTSNIDPSFWHSLTTLKLDVLKLEDSYVDGLVHGVYGPGRSVTDRETGKDISLGCQMSFFEQKHAPGPGTVVLKGRLQNFNTFEDFKSSDMEQHFSALGNNLRNSLTQTENLAANDINTFLALTFADLKKYQYFYLFGFPAFKADPAWQLSSETLSLVSLEEAIALGEIYQQHASSSPNESAACLLKKTDSGEYISAPLSAWSTFFEGIDSTETTVLFLDPSPEQNTVGWPLRTMLMFLNSRFKVTKTNIICWRDDSITLRSQTPRSRKAFIELSAPTSPQRKVSVPKLIGWERNSQGKIKPQVADLAPMMDPHLLADQAVDLNLKLMRWRLVPSLNLDKIKNSKCLLLGAGTLGCYVARSLLAWGVKKITFVDSSTVSFSNPVRQPLFTFEDSINGGKPKAECAAASLKAIYPGVDATGIKLSIPMPGHTVSESIVNSTKQDVELLEQLFDEHDVIYLLMDSRESRWLPTLLGSVKGKLVINAALGFDTYVVMRHGAHPKHGDMETTTERLGCYYCNDIVAPRDSLSDRTLDQMCTVTRPGLAAIAGATAAELMASIVQHPLGALAPDSRTSKNEDDNKSVLGEIPHQIRGSLRNFQNDKISGRAFAQCTACSHVVMNEYNKNGFDFLLNCFNDGSYLERVTGLNKVHEQAESALDSIEWDVNDEEGDDF